MTKETLEKACMDYGNAYVKKNVPMPKSQAIIDTWDRADFLRFKTRASAAVSAIELDIKGMASKVSDEIYEQLITAVGGEKA